MEKGKTSGLFINDGSFMERFKQLQEKKEKDAESDESGTRVSGFSIPKVVNKTSSEFRANESRKGTLGSSSSKLAFSLKQKSKLAAPPVKFGEDEDEDEDEKDTGNPSGSGPGKRQKLGLPDVSEQSLRKVDAVPSCPSDPTVMKVADKLASFVAKNGRQFEHITRQKNPGDTPFKFLFDDSCADYKYYEYRLSVEEKALSQATDSQTLQSGGTSTTTSGTMGGSVRSHQPQSNYQIPTSALYDATGEGRSTMSSTDIMAFGRSGESSAPTGGDPLAMMEFYVKKAAQEERRRQPRQSKDEMPPPASLQGPGKKGHHMGDYIPTEELVKFLANCDDVAAQKAAKEAAEKARIQADNVGHKLLSKMGWREGEGLGSSKMGMANPIMAGDVKLNNLGVGAHQPGEVTPDDDIYEQYKKRMMLGYKHRPNPMNNPRKEYY